VATCCGVALPRLHFDLPNANLRSHGTTVSTTAQSVDRSTSPGTAETIASLANRASALFCTGRPSRSHVTPPNRRWNKGCVGVAADWGVVTPDTSRSECCVGDFEEGWFAPYTTTAAPASLRGNHRGHGGDVVRRARVQRRSIRRPSAVPISRRGDGGSPGRGQEPCSGHGGRTGRPPGSASRARPSGV